MAVKGAALLFLAASFCNEDNQCESHYWYAPFYNTSMHESTCQFFAESRLNNLTKGWTSSKWRVDGTPYCEIALPFETFMEKEQR